MKPVGKTLATVLILGLLIITWEMIEPLPPDSDAEWNSRSFWIAKTFAPPQYDIVAMGDSRIYRGISPEAMGSLLPGCRILNFGYSGGGLNQFMFKAASAKIAPDNTRKVILMGVSPYELSVNARKNEAFHSNLNLESVYNFERWMVSHGIVKPFQWFRSLSSANLIRSGLDHPFLRHLFKQNRFFEEYYVESGWVASWFSIPDPDRALIPYQYVFENNEQSLDSIKETLDFTYQWSHKPGQMVFALRLPTTGAMLELENRLSGFDEKLFVKRFEQMGGIWLTPASHEGYVSYDGSHLDKVSAQKLSRMIAKEMASYLRGC